MLKCIKERVLHYIRVYIGFVQTCFIEAMTFRTHFFLLIIMDLFFYFSTIATIDIIFDHVATIGLWGRYEMLFFVSVMLAINQLHMTFISESFWELSLTIRTGLLDFVLLKPIGTIFSVFFRYFRPGSSLNMFATWSMVIYYGIQVQLSWAAWIILPFVVLSGFLLAAGMEMIIACSMFWLLEGNAINFLRLELQQLARWPDFIYGTLVRRVLTVFFPVLLVGNAPVRFILNFQDWRPLLGLGIALIIVWSLLGVVWKRALNAYESASS